MNKIRGVKINTNTEVVKRLYFFVLLALFFVLLFTYSTFSARADIATILPEMYSVTGEPLQNNESSVQYTQYEYIWTNFQNDIVGGTTVQNVILKFSWSYSENDSVTAPQDESTSSIEGDTPSSTDETIAPIENEPADAFHTQETIPEDTSNVTPIDTSETTTEEKSALESIDTTQGNTLPVEDSAQTNTDTTPELQVLLKSSGKFLFATEQLEEPIPLTLDESSVGAVTQPEEIEPIVSDEKPINVDEVVLVKEPDTPEVDNSTPQPIFDTSVFQILYSLDGQNWELLGKESFTNPGEVALTLSQLSIESIHDLRIMVRYIQTTGDVRKIYFDNVHIDIDVEPLLESPRVYSDNEPDFGSSAIKADIKSGAVRAILLERGGMLELWYSITNTKTQKIIWTKLLNDGSIDETSPIAIKAKTIFWLDKNQQTLFGFNIDEKSIFGEALNESDSTHSSLTFEDENSKQWDATFDSDTQSFEFSKSVQP